MVAWNPFLKKNNYYLANRLQYILKCITQNPLDQVWLDNERTFCEENPSFSPPIHQPHYQRL